MHTRNVYIERIWPFMNKPVVKVITGMRRVGKSVLVKLLISRLEETGVSPKSIVYIDKESYA